MGAEQTRDRERARQLLSEAWDSLARQAGATALYGSEDRRVRAFQEAFVQAARACLELQGWMISEIGPGAVTWQGRSLIGGDPLHRALPASLYARGLRGVTVEAGADAVELRALAELLCRDWGARSLFDEDLGVAIWAADLRQVWLDLEEPPTEAPARELPFEVERLETLRERLLVDRPPLPMVPSDLAARRLEALRAELAMEAPERDELHDRVQVTERQRLGLQEELAALAAGESVGLGQVGRVLFELVRLIPEPERSEDLGRSMGERVLGLTVAGDTQGMAELLRPVLLLLDPAEGSPTESAAAFQRGFSVLVKELRPAWCEALDAAGAAARGALFTALGALPRELHPELVALCSELGVGRLRQVVADRLVLWHHRSPLVPGLLETARGRDAIAPLLALSRLSEASCIEACLRRARDPDPEVREAALKALRRHQAPRIRALVGECLRDSDPVVRVEALRYVSVYRDEANLPLIREEILSGRRFAAASQDEARAWLLAFARIGHRQAFDLLLGIAGGRQRLAAEPPGLLESTVQAILATQDEGLIAELQRLAGQRPELGTLLRRARGGGSR